MLQQKEFWGRLQSSNISVLRIPHTTIMDIGKFADNMLVIYLPMTMKPQEYDQQIQLLQAATILKTK